MTSGRSAGTQQRIRPVENRHDHRTRAIVIGILFVFAIVVLFVGEALYAPILDSPDQLSLSSSDRARVVLGFLVEFTGIPAVILISALFYPVLRQQSESLAIAYVGVRVLEGAILTIAYVAQLSRLGLVQPMTGNELAAAATVDHVLGTVGDWAGTTGLLYLVTFCLGAMLLFVVLYRARLVPQPIAGWGVLAAVILLIGAILANLDLLGTMSGPALELAFAAPIAVAELLLAGWLITRGFTVDGRSSQ